MAEISHSSAQHPVWFCTEWFGLKGALKAIQGQGHLPLEQGAQSRQGQTSTSHPHRLAAGTPPSLLVRLRGFLSALQFHVTLKPLLTRVSDCKLLEKKLR